MSTRTAKTAAKKTAAKNPAKTTPAAPPRKRTASKTSARAADRTPKAKLPTRTRTPNTGDWMTDTQGYATLHALLADITTPNIQDWHDHHDGTATRSYNDGTLTYRHNDRRLTWTAECPRGAHHEYALAAPGDFPAARRHLGWCTNPHTPDSAVQPLARALGDNLTRSHSTTAETQPLSRNQIDAGLHDRATDEQAKEHPQP